MKNMTMLIMLLTAGSAWGLQTATNMSYQGKLLDKNGIPQNVTLSMTFAVYGAPTGGTSLWSETVNNVPVRCIIICSGGRVRNLCPVLRSESRYHEQSPDCVPRHVRSVHARTQ